MPLTRFLLVYAITRPVFLAIDVVWLGVVARRFYGQHIGHLLAAQVNWGAAILFYLVFIAGIVFFAVRPALESSSTIRALTYGALFGGSQYTSTEFRTTLTMLYVRQSMGRTGSWFDNAVAESFFATLKSEIGTRVWATRAEARRAVEESARVTGWDGLDASGSREAVAALLGRREEVTVVTLFDRSGRTNLGHALETAVLIELERRRCAVTYVRTASGFEGEGTSLRPVANEGSVSARGIA